MTLKNDWADGNIVHASDINDIADTVNNVGGIIATAVKTADYAAEPGELVPCDATSGSITVTLPNDSQDGSQIIVEKVDPSANTVTVICSGSDRFNIKPGGTSSLALSSPGQAATFQYANSTGIWYIVSGTTTLTNNNDGTASASNTTLTTPLTGLSSVTTGTTPAIGKLNPYDAASGPITATLHALSSLSVGSKLAVRKADSSSNSVTLNCNGGDTFLDSSTNIVLRLAGEQIEIQVVSVSGVKHWSFTASNTPLSSLDSRYPVKDSGGKLPVSSISTTGTASSSTFLRGDGSWSAIGAVLSPVSTKTGNYSAAAGNIVPCDATSASFSVILPANPPDKSQVCIKKNDSSSNTITINCSGSDVFNVIGGGTSMVLRVPGDYAILQYSSSSAIWHMISGLPSFISSSSPLARSLLTTTTQTAARKLLGASGATGDTDTSIIFPRTGLLTWYEMSMLTPSVQWLGHRHARLGEPNPTDREVKFFADNGIQAMLTILPQNGPYGTDESGVTAMISDYLAHISTILNAYGPGGTYWTAHPTVPYNPITYVEIFNEPNFYWDNGIYTGTATSSTGASVSDYTATIKFPTQPDPPIEVGEWINIRGISPTGYNSPQWGKNQVTAVTNTPGNYSISYTIASTSNTGTQTASGSVTYSGQKAKHYAKALIAAYDHIKNHWPDVVVIGFAAGDTSAAGNGWISSVLAYLNSVGRLDCFDIVSDHPYTWKSLETPMSDFFGTWSGITTIGNIKSTLKSYGVSDRPMWITELGFPITAAEGGYYSGGDTAVHYDGSPAHFTQERSAAWSVRTAITAARLGIDRIYYMNVCDTDNFNGGWFNVDAGTLSYQMSVGASYVPTTPRKIAVAMRLLNRLVWDATKIEILLDGLIAPTTAPFAYRFHTPRGKVTVAWCDVAGNYSIPVDPDISQRVTTQLGVIIDMIGGSSTYSAPLSESPIFIFPVPPPVKSIKTVTNSTLVLTANPDAEYTTYLGVNSAAVMPSPSNNISTYNFVNTDTSAHTIYTSVNTSSLLHFEGSNGSTTMTDSAPTGSNWTALGSASISTAQYKVGSSSLAINVANAENRANNSGSRIKATASTESFAFGTGDFTIEFWIRFSNIPSSGQTILMDTRPNTVNGAYGVLFMEAATFGNKIIFYNGGSPRLGSIAPVVDTWTHVALSRASGQTRLFIDGVMTGSPYNSTPTEYTDTMDYLPCSPVFGSDSLGSSQISGYMDEIRITKGLAKYTSNFSAPVSQLSTDGSSLSVAGGGKLTLASNGTSWVSL